MRQDALSTRRASGGLLETTLSALLGRDFQGARLRAIVFGVGLAVYWLSLAFFADFPRVLPEAWLSQVVFPLNVLLDLITSLLAPAVLLHLLPVVAAAWLAMRLASHYLADLFELESPAIAERYLQASVLGLGYDTLHVSEADVSLLNQGSPLLRIGGPAYLQVHLGYAVVMETADGLPRVYGPDQRRFVHGFERLRDVIDLRDQLRELKQVRAVTADGIEVIASNVQMMFRVFGGGQERSLEAPYPYTEGAIRRLVYGRAVGPQGMGNWSGELTELAVAEIRSFVADLTLEGFLALQPEADHGPAEAGPEGRRAFHIPRHRLTERFHTGQAKQRLQEHGLELDWVGVGTWEIGQTDEDGAVSIGKTIVGAWQNLQRSRLLRSPSYLSRQQERGFQDGICRPLEGWVALWRSDEFPGRHRVWSLLNHVHRQLRTIHNGLADDQAADELPVDLAAALDHLAQFANPQRLGGPGQ